MKNPRTREVIEADKRLKRIYGEPRKPARDAVSQLIATMLSQATTDVQTARSFDALRRRYPTWEQVRDAPVSRIAQAIRSSGLSKQKAPRIKQALRHITGERGRIELNFLKKMPVDQAEQWLMSIAGVGPKTASIVLLFSFRKPLFPVDTHVYRVTKRLGWIPQNVSVEQAHDLLRAAVPPRLHYRLHLNLIEHGRKICLARKPRCAICVLKEMCEYYRTVARNERRVSNQTGKS
jgi:endonuclease III